VKYLSSSLLIIIILFIFTACDNQEQVKNPNGITLSVDAGKDRRVKINELLVIKGIGSASDGSQLEYRWKHGKKVLSTTDTLQYIPTVLGKEQLDLSIQHNSGEILTNSVIITVVPETVSSEVKRVIPPISKALIEKFLAVVNHARSLTQDCHSKGIFSATTALTWNEKLYKAAYEHNNDLIVSQTYSHDGSGQLSDWTGTDLGKRSTFIERVESYSYEWRRLGENLGAGTEIDSVEKIVNGWLASDNHCANLMNPYFTELGMSMIKDEASIYTYYWTQEFGKGR